MKNRYCFIALLSFALLVFGTNIFDFGNKPPQSHAERNPSDAGRGLEAVYRNWAAKQDEAGGDDRLILALGYSKGLSASFLTARGQVTFDLAEGAASVLVSGLAEDGSFDVWLIDNRPGPGRSVKPEAGDGLLRLGRLQQTPAGARLEADLAEVLEPGFEIDLVAVAPSGQGPGRAGLLFGSPRLFQRLYYGSAGGPFAVLGQVGPLPGSRQSALSDILSTAAQADGAGAALHFDPLIASGREIFFNETFDGNGRTCGSCHPAENNFTIDPAFIATLPDDDPLFVAEFLPALAQDFENPRLMRDFGLILENQDGFGDLANDFNMRGVPHTLAMTTSLAPATSDNTTLPPNERTGWAGDGAPGSGTLREFAMGAVRQHFPLTLNRIEGEDFRFPTEFELDALEAFQLSLGRQEELILPLALTGVVAARGQDIFLDNDLGKCNRCHLNAGANNFSGNANFDTGVEDLADQPAQLTGELVPLDDGFGAPGDGSFNTPTLVEAADSGPFFHNNAIETIEGAVAFYNGAAFNNSPAGTSPFINGISLEATQVVAVAAFLRVVNALENIRSADALAAQALGEKDKQSQVELATLAQAEILDAVQVLRGGGLHPDAVQRLERAGALLGQAAEKQKRGQKARYIERALEQQEEARSLLVED